MSRFVIDFTIVDALDKYRLNDRFETFEEADRRASVIALNGARMCLETNETWYIPQHRIGSVVITDLDRDFVPNVTCIDLWYRAEDER